MDVFILDGKVTNKGTLITLNTVLVCLVIVYSIQVEAEYSSLFFDWNSL